MKIQKLLLLASTLCLVSTSASAEKKEVPELGLRYEMTSEMEEAGITLFESGISAITPAGEIDIEQDGKLLGAILVMEDDTFQTYGGDQNAEEVFLTNYPSYGISSEENDTVHYLYVDCKESETDSEIVRQFFDTITYIPLVPQTLENTPLTFNTLNIDGEPITDAILKEKDITILNVWATYCNPCINEMPELAAWEKELPENVQLLYLCSDLPSMDSSNLSLAETIADKAGINRRNILLWTPDEFSVIQSMVSAVPTTFFIDGNGNLTDEMVVGAYVDEYKETLEKLLTR